jgi:hypothetical protein
VRTFEVPFALALDSWDQVNPTGILSQRRDIVSIIEQALESGNRTCNAWEELMEGHRELASTTVRLYWVDLVAALLVFLPFIALFYTFVDTLYNVDRGLAISYFSWAVTLFSIPAFWIPAAIVCSRMGKELILLTDDNDKLILVVGSTVYSGPFTCEYGFITKRHNRVPYHYLILHIYGPDKAHICSIREVWGLAVAGTPQGWPEGHRDPLGETGPIWDASSRVADDVRIAILTRYSGHPSVDFMPEYVERYA